MHALKPAESAHHWQRRPGRNGCVAPGL